MQQETNPIGAEQDVTEGSPILAALRSIHEKYRIDFSGTNAKYIPELAKADPLSSASHWSLPWANLRNGRLAPFIYDSVDF